MRNIQHKKHRNTGLIWEILTRQVTSDLVESEGNSKAIEIIREYFKGTELSKELELYKLLMNEKFEENEMARDFIDEVLKVRSGLDDNKIDEEKYNLVGEIKENYDLKTFFKTHVNGYTELASTYKLFEARKKNANPAAVVRSRKTLTEHVIGQTKEPEGKSQSSIFEGMDKDMIVMTQKVMLEKYNAKYGEDLLPEQRLLMQKFIGGSPDLRTFINDEASRVKQELTELSSSVPEDALSVKIKEVAKLADSVKHEDTGSVRREEVVNLMMFYDLTNEIKNAR